MCRLDKHDFDVNIFGICLYTHLFAYLCIYLFMLPPKDPAFLVDIHVICIHTYLHICLRNNPSVGAGWMNVHLACCVDKTQEANIIWTQITCYIVVILIHPLGAKRSVGPNGPLDGPRCGIWDLGIPEFLESLNRSKPI